MVMTKAPAVSEVSRVNTNAANRPTVTDCGRITTLTSEEVAWLFGIEQTTLSAWVKNGVLVLVPCSVTPDGKERFLRSDVAELLENFGL